MQKYENNFRKRDNDLKKFTKRANNWVFRNIIPFTDNYWFYSVAANRIAPFYSLPPNKNTLPTWWLLSRSLCPVVLLVLLHDWYLCGCWRCRNDDCTELWKMTIRLTLGFRLKSVGCLLCSPIWTNKTFCQSYNSVFRKNFVQFFFNGFIC